MYIHIQDQISCFLLNILIRKFHVIRKLSEDSIDSLPDLERAVSTVNQIDLDGPSDLVNNPNTLLSYHQPSTSGTIYNFFSKFQYMFKQ